MGADRGDKGACHSDATESVSARQLQSTELDPVTLEPLADSPPV